jgi:hypothetical protein
MFVGILLLLIGVLMLLSHLNIIHGSFWGYAWPAIIIALGLSLVFKHTKR